VVNDIFPIVVVGHNRTRMTLHNIIQFDMLTPNIKKIYIISSDRSYPHHCLFLKHSLNQSGIDSITVETDSERYGLGAAINNGLSKAFVYSDDVFVLENDYLLRKKLDLQFYRNVLEIGNIGHISFKHINSVCNIRPFKHPFDGEEFILKLPNRNGHNSFSVELGCQYISKRLIDKIGNFKENCKTSEVEQQYIDRYNSFNDEELVKNRILACIDGKYYHNQLNSENCVFYHIGDSTQGCRYNPYPDEYKYLNDDEEDRITCERFGS